MIKISDKVKIYYNTLDEELECTVLNIVKEQIQKNVYEDFYILEENGFGVFFEDVIENLTTHEIYHPQLKRIHKFDVRSCVHFKNSIYEILWVNIVNNLPVYTLSRGFKNIIGQYVIDTNEENLMSGCQKSTSKYHIGDIVSYYDQMDDSIKSGKIVAFEDYIAIFENKEYTFIDFINFKQKLSKFSIGDNVVFNGIKTKIKDIIVTDKIFCQIQIKDKLEFVEELKLSPTI